MSYHRFSILQGRAVTDRRVSNSQLRVLAALGMYADKDGWCYPSQSTIGNDLGKSRQTVNGDIAALNELGYIEKHVTKTGKGEEVQVKYRLLYDTLDGGDVESPRQPLSSLPDSNDPCNDPINTVTDVTNDLPLEWKIAAGQEVTTLPGQKLAQQKDAARLVSMGTGSFEQRIYDLCFAFQQARNIVLTNEDVKGNRKVAKELVSAGVQPHHVVDAVRELLGNNMTVVNMFSIRKTALGVANPAPNSKKKSGYVSPKPGL